MSTPASEILAEAQCYMCNGVSMGSAIKLGQLAILVKDVNANADTTYETLLADTRCYACFGLSTADLLELGLLNLIRDNL